MHLQMPPLHPSTFVLRASGRALHRAVESMALQSRIAVRARHGHDRTGLSDGCMSRQITTAGTLRSLCPVRERECQVIGWLVAVRGRR